MLQRYDMLESKWSNDFLVCALIEVLGMNILEFGYAFTYLK